MSIAEPEGDEPIWDFDNLVRNIEILDNATHGERRQSSPSSEVLPDEGAIGDLESRVATLADADTDAEKVSALKDLVRWLAQWTF